jgi:hypothetical protein
MDATNTVTHESATEPHPDAMASSATPSVIKCLKGQYANARGAGQLIGREARRSDTCASGTDWVRPVRVVLRLQVAAKYGR